MSNRITFENVRLAFEPELRFTSAGKAVCEVKFADQMSRKNEQTGQWENTTDPTWVTASVWEGKAEALVEAVHKGDQVTVSGTLVTRNYERKDGGTGSALEVKFATVAVVPAAPKAARQSPEPAWGGAPKQADPWAAKSDSAPF